NNNPANLNPANQVVARLAATGNGIELVDGSPVVGANQLQVQTISGSSAAIDLGLVAAGQSTSAPSTPAGQASASLSFPVPNDVNTAFRLTANQGGTSFNGVDVVFIDSQFGNVANATYNAGLKRLTINLDRLATTTNTIISAIQAEGTF